MTRGMGHVGFSRDCPLCPEGIMGQDRQHNMTHGMGHVGYSRDCPLFLKEQWDRTESII